MFETGELMPFHRPLPLAPMTTGPCAGMCRQQHQHHHHQQQHHPQQQQHHHHQHVGDGAAFSRDWAAPRHAPPSLPLSCLQATAGSTPFPGSAQSGVAATLDNAELWRKFNAIGTEMIITKSGRRSFPPCKLRFSGLDPNANYFMLMELVPADEVKYKWREAEGRWEASGPAELSMPSRLYVHPSSPSSGAQWMRQPVSFHKAKLTNNALSKSGHLILHSMHKYQPCFYVVRDTDWRGVAAAHSPLTFSFPDTTFIAVTAYQNSLITKLKIATNPFAKGFREDGLNHERIRKLRSRNATKRPLGKDEGADEASEAKQLRSDGYGGGDADTGEEAELYRGGSQTNPIHAFGSGTPGEPHHRLLSSAHHMSPLEDQVAPCSSAFPEQLGGDFTSPSSLPGLPPFPPTLPACPASLPASSTAFAGAVTGGSWLECPVAGAAAPMESLAGDHGPSPASHACSSPDDHPFSSHSSSSGHSYSSQTSVSPAGGCRADSDSHGAAHSQSTQSQTSPVALGGQASGFQPGAPLACGQVTQSNANAAAASAAAAAAAAFGQTFASQNFPSQSFGSQSFGSQGFGSQSFGSQGFGSQSFGSQSFGSQAYGSQAFGYQAPVLSQAYAGRAFPSANQAYGGQGCNAAAAAVAAAPALGGQSSVSQGLLLGGFATHGAGTAPLYDLYSMYQPAAAATSAAAAAQMPYSSCELPRAAWYSQCSGPAFIH
ncbi:unnamed protein product [Lampetra fluviatilis]